MTLLLAQAVGGATMLQWIIVAIIVLAAIAILFAVTRHFGISIPPVLVFIFWVIVIAVVAIFAIKLLWSML
jgi:hypothetical protein